MKDFLVAVRDRNFRTDDRIFVAKALKHPRFVRVESDDTKIESIDEVTDATPVTSIRLTSRGYSIVGRR
jgi:hypothetical protein